MHGGFLNLVERVMGKGKLFHCRWCRLQYYDRRSLASEVRKPASVIPEVQHTADPAK
jgi:hypothetical protein